MRRKILITVIFILALLLATVSTVFAADEQYQIVRIKLSIGTPAEFSFFTDGNYTIGADGAGLERQLHTVKLEGGVLNLYNGSERIASGASIKLVRHAETAGRNSFIWMYNERAMQVTGDQTDKFRYLGDMEFIIESGHIAAVNHLYIEDYLYGVVPWEMSDSFPKEALKAQAVSARNYAEKHINSANPYDMVDTSINQVYNGYYYPLKANSMDAVDKTKGNVLTFGAPENIIEAFFSASNGGYTDIPYHRWGSGSDWAYYQFSEDTYDRDNPSSLYETITFPTAFASYDGVTVADNVTGTPDKMKAIACIKQAIFDNAAFRAAYPTLADRNGFELTGVQSLATMPGEYDKNGNEDHSRIPATGPNNCVDIVKAKGTFRVTIPGVVDPVTVSDVEIDLRYLDGSTASPNNEFKAFNADALTLFVVAPVTVEGSTTGYSISQKRYGQGIGLSQRGAEQRANTADAAVNTFDKILAFYYPGTTLTTQGYTAPTLTSASVPDHSNATLITDLVRVRKGPGTTYDTINRLPLGARIEVVPLEQPIITGNITWNKIYYAGQYAYIAAVQNTSQYVQLDSPLIRQPLTVNFVTNGGSAVSAGTLYHADSFATAPVSTKSNYDLEGWYFDEALTSKMAYPYILTQNMTFYAKWVPTPYSIGYDLRGGAASNPACYTVENGAITLNNPTRNGYTFAGWTGTGLSSATMTVTIPAGSTGTRTYYANWSPITYSISYNVNGGSSVSNPVSYTIESPTFMLSNPTMPEYAFVGWTGTGLSGNTIYVTIPSGSTGNRAYTANWAPYVCTVNFDSQGGTPVAAMQRGLWGTLPTEPATSRYGYNFAGWFNGAGQRVSFPYTVTDNTTLYARWNAQPQTNGLAGVSLSSGSLNRGFVSSVTSYKITIGENDGSFTLVPYKQFDGASMTINGKAYSSYTVSLANGKSATITVKVTLAKKAKTYKFTVTRSKSSNNYLSALSTAGGVLSQPFNPNVQNYTLFLDENTKSTTIKAVAAAGKAASLSPASSKVSLNNGQSKAVKITVKAQSGAKRTYTINVVRAASSNANLKSLKASGMSPGFSPGNTNYTIVLPANKSTASISASAVGYKAVVYIDGAKKSSKKVTLANGQSTVVRVTVVSQSGIAKDYWITVIRQ